MCNRTPSLGYAHPLSPCTNVYVQVLGEEMGSPRVRVAAEDSLVWNEDEDEEEKGEEEEERKK